MMIADDSFIATRMVICQATKVLTTLAFGVNMTHAHLRFAEYDEWHWTEDADNGGGWHTARWG